MLATQIILKGDKYKKHKYIYMLFVWLISGFTQNVYSLTHPSALRAAHNMLHSFWALHEIKYGVHFQNTVNATSGQNVIHQK